MRHIPDVRLSCEFVDLPKPPFQGKMPLLAKNNIFLESELRKPVLQKVFHQIYPFKGELVPVKVQTIAFEAHNQIPKAFHINRSIRS